MAHRHCLFSTATPREPLCATQTVAHSLLHHVPKQHLTGWSCNWNTCMPWQCFVSKNYKSSVPTGTETREELRIQVLQGCEPHVGEATCEAFHHLDGGRGARCFRMMACRQTTRCCHINFHNTFLHTCAPTYPRC